MENFLQIIIIAILAEAVWENLKMVWQQGKISIDKIGALIISIVITLSTQLDVFAILNFKISIPKWKTITRRFSKRRQKIINPNITLFINKFTSINK